jgi:hypothetical protein
MSATRTNGTNFQGFVPARGYLVVAIVATALITLLKGAGL